jgi:autoinducer 2-degrading protein
MAYSFLSRFQVKADRDAEFVALIAAMEANARDEPGTLAYQFYRIDGDHMFAVYERFVDEAADKAHQANPASAPIIEQMIECMAGTYVRELLHDVSAGE